MESAVSAQVFGRHTHRPAGIVSLYSPILTCEFSGQLTKSVGTALAFPKSKP